MREYDNEEERQAKELIEHLAVNPRTEAEEELAALAEFSESLPWEEAAPSAVFEDRLQQELLRRIIVRPRPQWPSLLQFDFGAFAQLAMILLLIAFVVIAVLAMMGPRIREIFGTVYNTLSCIDPFLTSVMV